MEDKIRQSYLLWLKNAAADPDIIKELKEMAEDDAKMEDAFYRNLSFGTGGLRGVIGAGSNRMNIYTTARASQGLSNYVKKHFLPEECKIAVSYDSRIKSKLFAQTAAGVFAANGIKAYIYPDLMPTPCLSFAVRSLKCAAGIMVTASHNPAKYNGYKVYGADGCQITAETAGEIMAEIEKLDFFEDVKGVSFDEGVKVGAIAYIPENISDAFIEQVLKQSCLGSLNIKKDVSIVYSPLNGTGLKPVLKALKESGYTNITVVEEQREPDGNFPTCPYPNPEIKEAMELGLTYAGKNQADLLLATDPDCDRVGIAVKNAEGEYVLLSGNETGILLFDYICQRRMAEGMMPNHPVMVKTIVTADMGEQIAEHYGVDTVNVLTGFKYIGEQIGRLETVGRTEDYIFGFEESYGYLSGSYVRDKDAVGAALLICEMFAYYASEKIRLTEKLEELYQEYGFCLNTLHSYEFEGIEGFERMQGIMQKLRGNLTGFGGKQMIGLMDYAKGIDDLPKSDVLKFLLEDHCSVVVRPSGTEPKLKVYVSVSAQSRKEAVVWEERIVKEFENICA